MNDKERLEEIEAKYSTLTISSEKNSTEYTEVDVEDLVFLIQNGFKQAERVQELEETVENYKTVNKELHQRGRKVRKQNKRYREALEYYGYEAGYTEDDGIKARQALEGEE